MNLITKNAVNYSDIMVLLNIFSFYRRILFQIKINCQYFNFDDYKHHNNTKLC